jgi:hypothetical protein
MLYIGKHRNPNARKTGNTYYIYMSIDFFQYRTHPQSMKLKFLQKTASQHPFLYAEIFRFALDAP